MRRKGSWGRSLHNNEELERNWGQAFTEEEKSDIVKIERTRSWYV